MTYKEFNLDNFKTFLVEPSNLCTRSALILEKEGLQKLCQKVTKEKIRIFDFVVFSRFNSCFGKQFEFRGFEFNSPQEDWQRAFVSYVWAISSDKFDKDFYTKGLPTSQGA